MSAQAAAASTAQAYLSPTFQSSALHAPLDVERPTICDPNYSRYLTSARPQRRLAGGNNSRSSGTGIEDGGERPGSAGQRRDKWGRHYSYGGIGASNTHEFTQYDPYGRPFGIRGHDHWTTGALVLPMDVALDEAYNVTDRKMSDMRRNDELVPRPLSVNVAKKQVMRPFPADHPFTSHTLQRDLFPGVEPPPEGVLDEETGLRRAKEQAPPFAMQTTVRHKTRGSSARHEKLVLFEREEEAGASKDRPLMNDVWDVDRSQRHKRALTYPAPQVLYSARPEQRNDMVVRPRTANALANMKYKSFQTSMYQGQHTGRGPKHINEIDDYEQKQTDKEFADAFPEDGTTEPVDMQAWKPGKKLTGTNSRGGSLKPASAVSRNSAVPPARFGGDGYSTGYHTAKPREGRHSRAAATNLQVQDSGAADEYGEMTAEGRMRPGTAGARCRSAGTVRFNADGSMGGVALAAKRPVTPWVARPGTGRYRFAASDEEGEDEEDGEESGEEGAGTSPSPSYLDIKLPKGSPPQQPAIWPASDTSAPRLRSACPYDETNFADDWRPGTGAPRPRSTYHQRASAFNKTTVYDQMHWDFPEKAPDVRDNQHCPGGKRHIIHGNHSYLYHHG